MGTTQTKRNEEDKMDAASATGRLILTPRDCGKSLPREVLELTNLKLLDLSRTNLNDKTLLLGDLGAALARLETLKLNDNPGLTCLPTSFGLLRSLKRLEINRTSVARVDVLPTKCLAHLEAIGCRFAGLLEHPILPLPSTIQTLVMSENPEITGLGDGFGFELFRDHLEMMDFNDCPKFSRIPPAVGELKRLQILKLERTAATIESTLPKELFLHTPLSRLELKGCRGITRKSLLGAEGFEEFMKRRLSRLNRDIAGGNTDSDRSICGLEDDGGPDARGGAAERKG